MSVRDEEIKRLIYYAKSLGAKVNIRDYAHEDYAEVYFEPKYTININKKYHRNKTQLILTLLHELSHVKYAILNDFKFSDAFLDEVWDAEKKPKKASKEIAEFEIESLELMTNIASELNIKIPMKKILQQKEHDQFMYKKLAKTGQFPSSKEEINNWKKLREKYK